MKWKQKEIVPKYFMFQSKMNIVCKNKFLRMPRYLIYHQKLILKVKIINIYYKYV